MRVLWFLFVLWAPAAHAQFGPFVQAIGSSSSGYVGPIDAGVVAPVACYSVMACSTAAATGTYQLFNVQRASDSHTCDLLAASTGQPGNTANCSTGGDNGQSLASFLSATTGTVLTWYDQTGNGNTATGSAGITVSCNNSLPCITFNGSTQTLGNNTFSSTAAQPVTFVSAQDRTGGTGANSGSLATYPLTIGGNNAANQASMYAGNTAASVPMTDNAWHSFIGVFNAASSTYYVDSNSGGSPTTTATNPGTGGLTTDFWIGSFHLAQYWTGSMQENLIYASGLSATNQGHLCGSQHTRLATPGTCS